MANPLQPKVIKCLKEEYEAFVVNIVSTSKSGTMDLIACIPKTITRRTASISVKVTVGVFYGFEIKWGKDKPSALQKQKINECIDAGGKAYFIRNLDELRDILDKDLPPVRYESSKTFSL